MILNFRSLLASLAILTALLAAGRVARADGKVRRNFEVEWEAIDGASLYEIKLTNKDEKKKAVQFKSKETKWSATIKPGKYLMQIRTFDERGAPGDWSPPTELEVKLPSVVQTRPGPNEDLEASDDTNEEIKLKWETVPGADKYKVAVHSLSTEWKTETETSDTSWSVKIPVAQKIAWNVTAIDPHGQLGDENAQPALFQVKGPPLKKPKIQSPLSKYLREMKWDPTPNAQSYSYELQYRDPKTRKWSKIDGKDSITDSKIDLDISRPSGRYRLKVQAHGDMRMPSKVASLDFETHGNFRDPAALETAMLRDSMVKPTNFYAITSYMITSVQYQAANHDSNQSSNFQAVGGTGRVGAGYQDAESNWGGFGIVDLSGFSISGQTFTFASIELHATRKLEFGQAGLLLVGAGAFSKELPVVNGSSTVGYTGTGKIREIGPHAGFTYWIPLSDRYGLQTNGRLYYSVLGSSASGGALEGSMSYQFGLLGTYRISKSWMGYAGYAYRKHEALYKAEPGQNGSFAREGDTNSVNIQGHYLNLLLEFSF